MNANPLQRSTCAPHRVQIFTTSAVVEMTANPGFGRKLNQGRIQQARLGGGDFSKIW